MFKKVILSPLGELTRDTRTVGDTIGYRIYYDNPTKLATDLVITDSLDKGLTRIRPGSGGRYDRATHTITWRVTDVAPWQRGFVEFTAVIGRAGLIRNQAHRSDLGPREDLTNTVETVAGEPPAVGWIPFVRDARPGSPPRVYMKDETTMGTTVRIEIPGVFVYEESVDGMLYQHVTVPGRAASTDIGKPELPVAGEAIEVPFGPSFTPDIIKTESLVLEGYNVYPAQPSPIAGPARPKPFAIDPTTYLTDGDYPPLLAVVDDEDIGVIRGHRVLLFKVNPLQVNPVTRQITAHRMVEVRLAYDRPAQLRGIDHRLLSPVFEDLLKATVLNYKPPERFGALAAGGGSSGDEKNGCDYLIITADAYYDKSQANDPIVKLARWKRRKGYRTRVVKVGTIQGGNTAAAIRAYIQDAYDHWNPAPSYVLLVGDSDQLVAHGGRDHPDELNPDIPQQPPLNTDLHYAMVDGTNYFPDIFIGRLSVDTGQQLADVVNKILAYEQNPPATPAHDAYYTDASLISLCQDTYGTKIIPTGRESFPWIATVEDIRDYLLGQNYNVERIYATNSGFPPAGPNSPSPTHFQDGTQMDPNDLQSPAYGWDGDAGDIRAAFNNGRFLVSYLAHGAPDAWDHPGFDAADIAALNQNDLTPVVFSVTCQTGWFDNEIDNNARGGLAADCFAETLLRRARAGAVAVIAQTRVSYVYWNSFLELGMFKAIWPDYVPGPPWTGHPAVPVAEPPRLLRMGQILNYGKMYMATAYGPSDHRETEFQMGHLFGDPEMPIWTGGPLKLDVAHPAGIGATGLQAFVVHVTDDATGDDLLNATVALTRDDAILQVAQTGVDGLAYFEFHSVGSGDIDVTVTALDYRPYMGTITVNAGGAALDPFSPPDGPEGQAINLGGVGFGANEKVDIHFGTQLATTVDASAAGNFGQGGAPDVITAPQGYAHGLVNVWAEGRTTHRFAVRVFQLRDQNPVDLWTYSQWDSSTWTVHPGSNPTWNSPDIQLYDQAGNPVASNNLKVNQAYTVKVKVRNNAGFPAQQASVTFRWRNYGIDGLWELFHPQAVTMVDVPANPPGEVLAENVYTPPTTGHLCIKVGIEHLEDTTRTNNEGQENLHVGHTNSPATVCFQVCNLTREPAPVHLEVRQLVAPGKEKEQRLWATWIRHPEPQILQPGDLAEACLIVDPDPADVGRGAEAEFAVTAFVGGRMVGGVNVIMIKQ
ncbi:MAG: hypothetical protein JXC32_03930 [Anaerolineae bacterium]|nr:hypothetical protein [Anaerolineae bacterium]